MDSCEIKMKIVSRLLMEDVEKIEKRRKRRERENG